MFTLRVIESMLFMLESTCLRLQRLEIGSTLARNLMGRYMVMAHVMLYFVFIHTAACIHNLKPGLALMS